MTVKNQPATPLPFSSNEDAIIGADGSDAGAPEVSDQNLAYVIHAANAYPKLVEALKIAAANADMVECQIAEALLRELGEEIS